METKIKVTQTGSYSAKFEHDDVTYRIDWEDDSDNVYVFQEFHPGKDGRKCVSIPAEILPTLIRILGTIHTENLEKQGKN
jgi:hypothetical protein